MKFTAASLLIASVFLVALFPVGIVAKTPNGTFHKVAFVVTVPDAAGGPPSQELATNEGNEITEKLKEAGFLVIQYPDPNTTKFSFYDKLKLVNELTSSPLGDQPGDVTLFYYFGHGADDRDVGAEVLDVLDDSGQKETVEQVLSWLTYDQQQQPHKSRTVLLFINACRCDAADPICLSPKSSAKNSTVRLNQKMDNSLDHDRASVLELWATTNGAAANIDLATTIANSPFGLNPLACDGIFPKSLLDKFPDLSHNQGGAPDYSQQALTELKPYRNISPFGEAFLLSISKPNQSLWNITSNIVNAMYCFVGSSIPNGDFSAEMPLYIMPSYYFSTINPDIDRRP